MPPKKRKRGRPVGTHPPAVYTASLLLRLTPEMKDYIMSHGGTDYIRRLVERDRKISEGDYAGLWKIEEDNAHGS